MISRSGPCRLPAYSSALPGSLWCESPSTLFSSSPLLRPCSAAQAAALEACFALLFSTGCLCCFVYSWGSTCLGLLSPGVRGTRLHTCSDDFIAAKAEDTVEQKHAAAEGRSLLATVQRLLETLSYSPEIY